MAVSTAYEPLTYTGNGSTTAFSVTWPFFSGSLVVTEIVIATGVETVKTINTHYTVSGGTDADGLPSTGTVTALTAPASTVKWRIERVTPRTQATVYTNNDAFPAKTTESAFDKLHLLMQEVLYESDRAIKLRVADREAGVDPIVPLVTGNGSEAVALNSGASGLEFASLANMDLDIGTVTTGNPGTDAAASITGTPPNFLLNLTIPRGNTGASGAGTGDLVSTNNLSDVANAATSRTNLGLGTGNTPQFTGIEVGHASDSTITRVSAGVLAVEGQNILTAATGQPLDADLTAIAGLTSAADRLPYFTGSGTAGLATFTAAGRALVDDADAAAQRTTLGLGTAAVLDVGTTASKVVQLDGSAKLPAVDGSQLTNVPGGKLVSRAYGSYTSNANLTSNIPYDDTIPQNTEGTEVVTASITPSSASNRVRVTFTAFYETSSGCCLTYTAVIAALFRDSTADAIYAIADPAPGTAAAAIVKGVLSFVFEHSPSTTSSTTYKVRVGHAPGSGTLRLNGTASARRFGGVAAATLVVEEISP